MAVSTIRLVMVFACFVITAVSWGQETKSPTSDEKQDADASEESQASKAALARVTKAINTIELETAVGDQWKGTPVRERPLLVWGDATRGNTRGTLWAWGTAGRPSAIAELYRVTEYEGWAFVAFNTSTGRIRATRDRMPWWNENESTARFVDLAGAPAPAETSAARQRQIKQLASRFTGHEFWDPDNSRFELRMIERPLLTYSDPENGILDGALFTLANGTNPEILLMLEARANDRGARFQWAVGRLAHAEIHLEFDGKELYSAPRGWDLVGPTKSYFASGLDDRKPE